MSNESFTLQEFLNTLPQGHHERAGVTRAIELLALGAQSELASLQRAIHAALTEHGHAGPEPPWCRSLILHEGTCNCWRASLAGEES